MPCDHVRIPVSIVLFLGSAALMTSQFKTRKEDTKKEEDTTTVTKSSKYPPLPPCEVVFVLGGPGTGKGTQCQLLTERLGKTNNDIVDDTTTPKKSNTTTTQQQEWAHLSAGDLLRAERKKSNSKLADIINTKIASGALVPSEITVQLLEQGMEEIYYNSDNNIKINKFLIDGFPRSLENDSAWQTRMGNKHNIKFVLNFVCPEEVLIGRLLERGQTSGRIDDANIDIIRKRFNTHTKECIPIIKQYEETGIIVHTIQSDASVEEVYKRISVLF